MTSRPTAEGTRRYACSTANLGYGRLAIRADPLEALIAETTILRLDSAELAKSFAAQKGQAEDDGAQAELGELQARLEDLGRAFGAGEIPMAAFYTAT